MPIPLPPNDRVAPSGEATAPSVRERIERALAGLSKKERCVAEYVLANPSIALFATAADIAYHAGVVPATVIRFARSIGFAGFADFREALRSEYPSLRLSVERLDEQIEEITATDPPRLVDLVRVQSAANLEKTLDQLDGHSLSVALDLILSARRIVVVGTAMSRSIATHLHRVLQTAEIAAHLVEDWSDLLFAATDLKVGDVLFAITVNSYMRVTVEALRLAHRVGARTIFLTDAPFAPGADVADVTLFYSPKAFGEFLSPLAGTAVVDCIAAGLAVRIPDRVRRAMRLQYDLLAAHSLTYR